MAISGWAPKISCAKTSQHDDSGTQFTPTEEVPPLVLGPTNQFSESGQHADNQFLPLVDDSYNENINSVHFRPDDCYYNGGAYQWQLLPTGLIYRQYLSGVKESRFRSVWSNETDNGNIWDVSLGGQVGLLRYGSYRNGRPIGWQLGIEGAGQVRLDLDENRDVDAADFRFGVPITWGDDISQVKLSFYHLSSHLADEFLFKNPGFPRVNYSRNVIVLGYSIYPAKRWRVYTEIGFGFDTDVSEPWETQFGIEYAPSGATGARGAPFAAASGHLREEVDFGGNFVFQAGWAWRRSPASSMFRIGVEYYNGKSEQYSFFNQSEQKVGFGMWYDY